MGGIIIGAIVFGIAWAFTHKGDKKQQGPVQPPNPYANPGGYMYEQAYGKHPEGPAEIADKPAEPDDTKKI